MNYTRNAVCSAGSRLLIFVVGLIVAAGLCVPSGAVTGAFVSNNTPSYVATAKNLGPVNTSNTIDVSLWLKPHNRGELDALAESLYNPASPNYRHFLTRAEFATRFAPTAAEAQTVRQFLTAHNLKIVRTGPNNFFVRARGTVAQIEATFHVQLNQYSLQGKAVRANNRDPFIEDEAAAALVHAVYGLDNMEHQHPVMVRPTDPSQVMNAKSSSSTIGTTAAATAATAPPLPSTFFSNTCFLAPETDVFSTNGNNSFPIGTYKGNHLNLPTLTSVGCGYTPAMIQAAYHLNDVYAAGFDGTGQTIGVMEACGSLSLENDANLFSATFGLPPLTPANFIITNPPIACAFEGNIEETLDVEWAHAIAPGATINVLRAPSPSVIDLDELEFTAVNNFLVTVLSGSFGSREIDLPPSFLQTENLISEIGAALGISTNFSTGDDGDLSDFFNDPRQFVFAPASSPWATAVGGISLALNPDNSIQWQAGWGTNETFLAANGLVFDPPEAAGFNGGSGGGVSNCVQQHFNSMTFTLDCLGGFPKPAYQSKLAGTTRHLPDVSWLADPFTGAVITFTNPAVFPPQAFEVIGGTSLSCPMFSALWAIANQAAGRPLGQAAPYLYSLPAGAITDVVPFTATQAPAKENVTASIQESNTVTKTLSATSLLGGELSGTFISGIWDADFVLDGALVVSFGRDCTTSSLEQTPFFNRTISRVTCSAPNHLRTAIGWDNVTGLGVPNPPAFVNSFVPAPAP